MALSGDIAHLLRAGLFSYGGMAFAIYPIVVAHLIDHLHQEDILSGNTGVLFLHGLGAAISPAIADALMGGVGAIALPLHLGLAFVPVALFAFLLWRRSADEIVEEAARGSRCAAHGRGWRALRYLSAVSACRRFAAV